MRAAENLGRFNLPDASATGRRSSGKPGGIERRRRRRHSGDGEGGPAAAGPPSPWCGWSAAEAEDELRAVGRADTGDVVVARGRCSDSVWLNVRSENFTPSVPSTPLT